MNKVDFIINVGTDWNQEVAIADQHGNPLNLSNYTATATIKKHYSSKSSTAINTSSPSAGVLNLSLSALVSGDLEPGRYGYDVVLVDISENHSKILEGTITFLPTLSHTW